ncbi:MAG TPA: thioredoxin fold domain-containing protein [Desulfobaccales bacterium]|jgi:tetratricopeptide (TPR) repeat protein
MGAVTYPAQEVAKFVDLNFIPVQIETTAQNQALMSQYGVTWTPSIFVLDADGKVHYSTVGFIPPEEFVPTFLVGKARWYFDAGQLTEARATLEEVLDRCSHSHVAPEAIFFLGVAKYKQTHDPKPLRAAYDELMANYPQSEWTKRADPYRLIEK